MEKQTLRFNYRIKPSAKQAQKLVEFASYARGVWNLLLSENIRRYEYDKTFVFYNDMANLLKELKEFEEFAWLKEMDSAAAQQQAGKQARKLDEALRACVC